MNTRKKKKKQKKITMFRQSITFPEDIEALIRKSLLKHPELSFSSVVILKLREAYAKESME